MYYLLLSILCGIIFSVAFKYIERYEVNINTIIVINYVSALLLSFIASINEGTINLITANSLNTFKAELKDVFLSSYRFSTEASAIWAIIIGSIFGPLFYYSVTKYNKEIAEIGISLANTYMKLSVVIPVITSMLVFNDSPSIMQAAGIFLCIVSIAFFNLDLSKMGNIHIDKNIFLLVLFGGISQFAVKLYQHYGDTYCKDLLTLFIFLAAFLTSLYYFRKETTLIKKREILFGILIGASNLFTTTFLLIALNTIKTPVAYLLSSLLSIIVVIVIGILFFHEHLSKKEIFGSAIALVAIILLNK